MKDNKVLLLGILAVIVVAGGALIIMGGPNCIDDTCTASPTALITAPLNSILPTASGAAAGDTVSVYYVGTLASGEVFDTTDEAIATASGLPVHTDALEFTIGEGQMIGGFEEGVKGMEEGEVKTLTIPAAEAYGEHDPAKVISIPKVEVIERTQEMDRVMEIALNVYTQTFGDEPVVGTIKETDQLPWAVEVTAVTETTTTLKAIVSKGDTPELSTRWPTTVVAVTDEKITVRADAEEGQVIDTPLGDATVHVKEAILEITYNPEIGLFVYAGSPGGGTVTEVTDDEIKIDTNHKLAGEDLTFKITLEKLDKHELVKAAVPELHMYVMSHCPYGQQAEASVEPVHDLLKEHISFQPRFVFYDEANYAGQEEKYCEGGACSMHGIGELNEGMRQLCIWEQAPAKWWDYVNCINSDTTYGNVNDKWDECAVKVGVDVDAVTKCEDERGVELALIEQAANQEYGVRGSPTIIINGEVYKGARDAESIKDAICATFENPPAACSQELGAAVATSTGSCA